MENPLELEIIKPASVVTGEERYAVWAQGYPIGSCIGIGSTEKKALLDAEKSLKASLALIQKNPQAITRIKVGR